MSPLIIQLGAAALFAIAVLHTFSVKFFERLGERFPAHAGIFHLLAEVEIVFGFWALILMLYLAVFSGKGEALAYLDGRNFTEPMFVFAIMVVAASKPIIDLSLWLVQSLARLLPMADAPSRFFVILFLVPLLGSVITEPAAMTLAAFLLRDQFYRPGLSPRLQYATLGVLFVNISIGGTLTPFAAPPVLMVASTWNWDLAFMLTHFGWRSALAVFINASVVTFIFHRELAQLPESKADQQERAPLLLTGVHLLFLLGVIVFAHHPAVFMGLLLFFIGIVGAYPKHQSRLIIRQSLLVAFFLAGLVVLGGQQQWWLQALMNDISPTVAYYGTTALTAITDNAALTYLGSLVEGLSWDFKYALVAGAVTGGGLTVIANAPNPAGYSILKSCFKGEHISAAGLFVAALLPTLVAILAFRWL